MIKYRQMLPQDAGGVETVEKACFAMPWSRESFWQEAAKSNAYYLLAVNESQSCQKIIGYAGMWLVFGEGQITNVAVLPSYRGCGTASELLRLMIKKSKQEKLTAMTLEVRVSNTAAIHLYEKFSFRSVGKRPHYYLDNGEDAEIMWLTF